MIKKDNSFLLNLHTKVNINLLHGKTKSDDCSLNKDGGCVCDKKKEKSIDKSCVKLLPRFYYLKIVNSGIIVKPLFI